MMATRGRPKGLKHTEETKAKMSETHRRNRIPRSSQEIALAARDRILLEKYDIDHLEYERMLKKQRGVCAICGAAPRPDKKLFPVDHCHKTGRVRGILCHYCNTMLGMAQDSPSTLEIAADYLRQFR